MNTNKLIDEVFVEGSDNRLSRGIDEGHEVVPE